MYQWFFKKNIISNKVDVGAGLDWCLSMFSGIGIKSYVIKKFDYEIIATSSKVGYIV